MTDVPSSQDGVFNSKLDRGTRLSIYWEGYSRWYCGVVDAHCPSELYGEQVYRIQYDDGQVVDENLASTKYNIVNVSFVGGRMPIDPRMVFFPTIMTTKYFGPRQTNGPASD
jgi:hypothetical protein